MGVAVVEPAIVLDQCQPRLSLHFRILVEAGVVERRREGIWVFLRIAAEGPVAEIIGQAEKWPFSARETRVIAHDARRLAAVRDERVCTAERDFAAHACEWDAHRARHLAESEWEAGTGERRAQHTISLLQESGNRSERTG